MKRLVWNVEESHYEVVEIVTPEHQIWPEHNWSGGRG